MNIDEIMRELAEYNRIADETQTMIDSLKDKLKDHMKSAGLDTLTGREHKCTYKPVTSTRLDSKALKSELPEIAARYMKETASMRFTFV